MTSRKQARSLSEAFEALCKSSLEPAIGRAVRHAAQQACTLHRTPRHSLVGAGPVERRVALRLCPLELQRTNTQFAFAQLCHQRPCFCTCATSAVTSACRSSYLRATALPCVRARLRTMIVERHDLVELGSSARDSVALPRRSCALQQKGQRRHVHTRAEGQQAASHTTIVQVCCSHRERRSGACCLG